jgi:hypothetical protein
MPEDILLHVLVLVRGNIGGYRARGLEIWWECLEPESYVKQ